MGDAGPKGRREPAPRPGAPCCGRATRQHPRWHPSPVRPAHRPGVSFRSSCSQGSRSKCMRPWCPCPAETQPPSSHVMECHRHHQVRATGHERCPPWGTTGAPMRFRASVATAADVSRPTGVPDDRKADAAFLFGPPCPTRRARDVGPGPKRDTNTRELKASGDADRGPFGARGSPPDGRAGRVRSAVARGDRA